MSISKDMKFPITCPECGREHKISLEDIAREVTIPCDCGKEIEIIDEDGKSNEVIKELDDLEKLVKQIGGRITLR